MQRIARLLAVVACVVLVPTLASAQASITGTVRDPSGAVLPGVTVKVSSPGLIEKVRTAVTDNGGQYRIVDLRPGTYAVRFALPGFLDAPKQTSVVVLSNALPVKMKAPPDGGAQRTWRDI